jgi:AraC family transcriptional regulator
MLPQPQDQANVDLAENEPAPAVTPRSQSGWRSACGAKPRSRVMVLDRESGTTRPIVEVPPLVSSTRAARQGFLVERMNVGSFNQRDIINLTHLVVLQVQGTAKLAWRTDGPLQNSLVHPGQISLVPAHLQHSVFSECLGEYVAVSLEPGFLLSAAAETGKLDTAEIPLLYGAEDPLLRELVCSLAKELCPPAPAEDLYAESVANLMATHVLHRYSQPRRTAPVLHEGLTRHQLRQVLDFIQANLAGDLSLAQLAAVVGLSPCHFARLFSGCVGLPPHQYIIRCRVELARSLLCQRFSSLADVAVRVGFCDQSHLSRHFTRQYGLTPGEFGRRFKTRKAVL